jgi:hypothetical protein
MTATITTTDGDRHADRHDLVGRLLRLLAELLAVGRFEKDAFARARRSGGGRQASRCSRRCSRPSPALALRRRRRRISLSAVQTGDVRGGPTRTGLNMPEPLVLSAPVPEEATFALCPGGNRICSPERKPETSI